MATTIRFKRSTSNKTGIVLKRGEPFYNTTTKKLYIGNSEDESLATKKAITDITSLSTTDSTKVEFTIGENSNNKYTKIIDNVNHAASADNATQADSATNVDNITNLSTGTKIKFKIGNKTFEHTVSGTMSGTMSDAVNVTSKINDVAISDIFEDDGKQAKTATHAEKATESDAGTNLDDKFEELTEEITNIKTGATSVPNVTAIEKTSEDGNKVAFKIGNAIYSHTIALDQVHMNVGSADKAKHAEKADKLTTARTLDGAVFAGTGNVTHLFDFKEIANDNTICTKMTTNATAEKYKDFTFNLEPGAHAFVRNLSGNDIVIEDKDVALNIQDTGAHFVLYAGEQITNLTLKHNYIYEFIYAGSDWHLLTYQPTEYGIATSNVAGIVKVGYTKPEAETANLQPVRLNDDNQMYVEITGEISGTSSNAKNVTEKINGKAISSIFESDGVTAKLAKYANQSGDIDIRSTLTGKYCTKTVGGISAGTQITKDNLIGLLTQLLGISSGIKPSNFRLTNVTKNAALSANSIASSINYSLNPGTFVGPISIRVEGGGKTWTSTASSDGSQSSLSGTLTSQTIPITNTTDTISLSGTASCTDGTLTASASISIARPIYYGPESELDEYYRTRSSSFTNITYTLVNKKAVFKYPSYWGELSSITDSNGFENIGNFVLTTANGYNTYTHRNAATDTYTYNFYI